MAHFSEDHKEIQSGKKLDDEGYMAMIEMDKINQSLHKLRKVVKSSKQQLPAWVQSKITKASDYLDIAADYLAADVGMAESLSFEVDKSKHEKTRKNQKILSRTDPKKNPKTEVDNAKTILKKIGVVLSPPTMKEETSLVDKILSEMIGDKPGWDIKKSKNIEDIAKKHNVSLDTLKKQLKKGMKVEMEHTTDKGEAEIIALQHLDEIPDYYDRLIKMEKNVDMKEENKSGDSNLRDWFKKSSGKDPKTGKEVAGWVQIGGPFAGAPCARQEGQKSTPKCGSSKIAANLSDKEEDKAFRRKNRKDPNQPEKTGAAKPTYVKTEAVEIQEKEEAKKDACYTKVKSRYKVWPSAYASGALVKCRKVGADNWGNKIDEVKGDNDPCWDNYKQEGTKMKKGKKVPNCVPVEEATTRLPMQTGQLIRVLINWRGKYLSAQLFFPQLKSTKRDEIVYAVNKIYPDSRVISYAPCEMDSNTPIIQVKEENQIIEDWQKVNRKDRTDGMSPQAVKAYRRENPGSKLKTAVTEKNPTGKRAGRRANYCSRSKGQQDMHNIDCSDTPDKPICKARRRWNC